MSLQDAKWFDLPFPARGVHEDSAVSEQPEGTSPLASNVRGFDLTAQRDRGCQRAGLLRLGDDKDSGSPIDSMAAGYLPVGFTPGTTGTLTDGTVISDLTGGTLT